jgi:uncharacterized protein (DUF1778 family)
MKTEIRKDNTLKLRIDNMTLEMLERAMSYVDLDKSKFVRQSIIEKAETVIAEHEKTRFTQKDWYLFFDMLDDAPEPTDRMKRAKQKYQEIIASDGI